MNMRICEVFIWVGKRWELRDGLDLYSDW